MAGYIKDEKDSFADKQAGVTTYLQNCLIIKHVKSPDYCYSVAGAFY
jgi:hypothetical protein